MAMIILPALIKNNLPRIRTWRRTDRGIGTWYGGNSNTKEDDVFSLINLLKTFARIKAVAVPKKYMTTKVNPCRFKYPLNVIGGIKALINNV